MEHKGQRLSKARNGIYRLLTERFLTMKNHLEVGASILVLGDNCVGNTTERG